VEVTQARQSGFRRAAAPALLAALLLAAVDASLPAQAPNPSSANNPFWGSITAGPATADTLKLSLDDAIGLGLKNNLGLREAQIAESSLQGQKKQALQEFLPTIRLTGDTGFYQHNLAALGFGPGTLAKFAAGFPGGLPSGISFITKDDLTQGQLHFNQTLFSGPVISAWRAVGAAEKSAYFAKMTARGEVIQQVASAYLHAIAASSEVDNAQALLSADQVALDHVHSAHEAGVAANLDELRARVQFQAQQQALIAAQNALEKDLILLKREIGLDPGQQIALTDPAPYSELAVQTPEDLRATAYKSRQDYQNMQNQLIELRVVQQAYRAQRLPTLSFGGYYGVSTVNGAGTHGNFVAMGTLKLPLFREARIRGDVEVAQANLDAISAQLADLRNRIDQQIRSALLDVQASTRLVEVARSNMELVTRALADETDRVNAGVDDNLPLVTAQAALASAQSNLVETLYQYNLSKLVLARSAGVIETQYREYLGR